MPLVESTLPHHPSKPLLATDIICRVVDNFGDIGFCWRLARELHHAHGVQVRLLLDDFTSASLIIAGIKPAVGQVCDGITISPLDAPQLALAKIVISAFGALPSATCPPAQHTIQLEYLSAESWVEDCHGRTALGEARIFYFPGFTAKTGGLLREQGLTRARAAFDPQRSYLGDYAVADDALSLSLFCYPQAPLAKLCADLADAPVVSHLFIPTPQPQHWRNLLKLSGSAPNQRDYRLGQCHIHLLNFLSQEQYDRLLWCCDCNFVRGEDSWVRALWAGKPLLWQPYPQPENAHYVKLEAFLARYTQGATSALAQLIASTHRAWSGLGEADWPTFFASLSLQKKHAEMQLQSLIALPELATGLVSLMRSWA